MKAAEIQEHKFLILGAARSGIAAARLLKAHGATVLVADSKSRDAAAQAANELTAAGIEAVWGDEANLSALRGVTIVVKSPGIPQDNPLVSAARAAGARIISEIELASAFIPSGSRVVAITGTNGKTTVTAWLTYVLNACGLDTVSAGNIGEAWSSQLLNPDISGKPVIFVVETSSFQLEDVEDFHPNVAVLTNLSPDHMDRYNDQMSRYVAAKANILRNLNANDTFIWNGADAPSHGFSANSSAQIRAFNGSGSPAETDTAAWVENGQIMIARDAGATTLMPVQALPLPGRHNIDNALAVTLAALALGAQPQAITAGLKSFAGVEHRIELCGTRADGVKFFNDSKATNLDAMEKALVAFDRPMVLIAGGRDAHSDYSSLRHLIPKYVMQLITLGEAAPLIEMAWGEVVPTKRVATMAEAVERANELAKEGTVVVFSPACKSFDMYQNYEERGRDFKNHVKRVLSAG